MEIEPVIRFKVVRAALGFADNAPLHRALKRHGIKHVEINPRVKGLTPQMYELLLSRATSAKATEVA